MRLEGGGGDGTRREEESNEGSELKGCPIYFKKRGRGTLGKESLQEHYRARGLSLGGKENRKVKAMP